MSGRLFWLASYPKSGNTWFRAFLRNLECGAKQPASINDLGATSLAAGRAGIDTPEQYQAFLARWNAEQGA